MATIFNSFDHDKNAFFNPSDTTKPLPGFPKVCITTFSEGIIGDFARNNNAKEIAGLYSANGPVPVYEIEYRNRKMGLFLSRIGAPACVAGLEEIIALGARGLVQFGSCGILNASQADNKIIIPSSAVRDEGTSYHYLPASEEIHADPASVSLAVQCLKNHEIPYVVGKTWTSDGIYRETGKLIEARKAQGCIAVEMECSASLAVAQFRGIPILQFLYGADTLDAAQWDIRDLTDYGISCASKYMAIALECGLTLQRSFSGEP